MTETAKKPARHSSENKANVNDGLPKILDPITAMVLWTLGKRGKIEVKILSEESLATFHALEKEGFVEVGKGVVKLTKRGIKEIIEPMEKAWGNKKNQAKKGHKIEVWRNFTPVPFADQIINEFGGHIFSDKAGTLWGYSELDGYWIEAEQAIMASLRNNYFSDFQQQNHYVAEIISHLRQSLYEDGRTEKPDWRYINLINGVFDIKNQKLEPHNPWYFFINRIELRLDENITKCPKIHKLFSDWVDEEEIISLYELVAYSLVDNYDYQKMFFLIGKGNNGKTKFADILKKIVGEENCTGLSLEDLTEREFERINLKNNKINIAGEINVKYLSKTSDIKRLVGGDVISARRLYHESEPFVNTCKLFHLTNNMPETKDKTVGFYRRFFRQMFTREFVGEDDNPNIIEELEEKEFQGLLYKSLYETLPNLIKRRFKFTNDESVEVLAKAYEELSNPLTFFVRKYFEEDSEGFVPIKVFKKMFKEYCIAKGDMIWTAQKLGRSIKDMGFPVLKRRLDEEQVKIFNDLLGDDFYKTGVKNGWECYVGITPIQGIQGFQGKSEKFIVEKYKKLSQNTLNMLKTLNVESEEEHQKGNDEKENPEPNPDKQKETTDSNGENPKEEHKDAIKTVAKILQGLNITPGDHGRHDKADLLRICNNVGLSTAEAITAIEELGGIETEQIGHDTVYDFSHSRGENNELIPD